MFVKVLALILLLGVCLAVPVAVPPAHAHEVPAKPDNSDLKADPSTWWHSYYHQTYPVYYYNVHRAPAYTYWHNVY